MSSSARRAPMDDLPQIKTANASLISALEAHPTFATEASQRKGGIYFTWDFVKRTDAMIDSVLDNTASDAQKEEIASDVAGRSMMINMMIGDTTGKTGILFGLQPGQTLDYGDAVKSAAADLLKVVS